MMKGTDEEPDDEEDVGITGLGDTHGTLLLLLLVFFVLLLLLLLLTESSWSLASLGGFMENSCGPRI